MPLTMPLLFWEGIKFYSNNYVLLSKEWISKKIVPLVKFKFLISHNKWW